MVGKSKRHAGLEMRHPGVGLAEDIEALGVTKSAFAKALGVSRNTLYLLLEQKIGISAEMAVRLEVVLGTSAESWVNLQGSYDLWKARQGIDTSELTRLWPRKETRAAAE